MMTLTPSPSSNKLLWPTYTPQSSLSEDTLDALFADLNSLVCKYQLTTDQLFEVLSVYVGQGLTPCRRSEFCS